MGSTTKIEWTDVTWNPVTGCTKVSAGCKNCYAEGVADRFWGDRKFTDVRTHEGRLDAPLRWRKPRRVFVNSMSDLFHEDVPDEFIDRVFAVMALADRHTFQLLTKRPERMREYAADRTTPFRVAKAMDAIVVRQEIAGLSEEARPIGGYPGYFVTNHGRVLSGSGSGCCLFCGEVVSGIATKSYCSKKCRQNACYYRRVGRPRPAERSPTEMSTDVGEQGHRRVTLYRDGTPSRELVHRLVLTAFDREPTDGEQACHRDGDPSNNALPNLRWGSQSSNWGDRKRHGNGHSHGDRHGIDAPIQWPLANCWKGVSCENQAAWNARVPLLLATPAAIHFVSAEPLLGHIHVRQAPIGDNGMALGLPHDEWFDPLHPGLRKRLDWIIVGGESGPGARPCDVAWIRSIVEQCQAAGIACFVKQMGANVVHVGISHPGKHWPNDGSKRDAYAECGAFRRRLDDRKGGDPAEWPEDLRVREFPR